MSTDLWKTVWEEPNFYHQFGWDSEANIGWLRGEEVITSIVSVTIERQPDKLDKTADMLKGQPTIVGGTKVLYSVKGGEAGRNYDITIKVITSSGQKLSSKATLKVIP